MMTALKRGAVVEYPAFFDFDRYPRPYVIVSADAHPIHGEEYIGLAITTTELDPAIRIDDPNWITSGLPKSSYVKPWQPLLLKHETIVDAFGLLEPSFVDRVTDHLVRVVGGTT